MVSESPSSHHLVAIAPLSFGKVKCFVGSRDKLLQGSILIDFGDPDAYGERYRQTACRFIYREHPNPRQYSFGGRERVALFMAGAA
jgi:hypothetical protein